MFFALGRAFLSLENFELPYLMFLLGAQLPLVLEPLTAPAASTVRAQCPGGEVPGEGGPDPQARASEATESRNYSLLRSPVTPVTDLYDFHRGS